MARDVYDSLEEQNEVMDTLLEKAKALEESLDVLSTATSSDVLVKLTRREEKTIRDSISCCICKGW